jgi:hypothetical protein
MTIVRVDQRYRKRRCSISKQASTKENRLLVFFLELAIVDVLSMSSPTGGLHISDRVLWYQQRLSSQACLSLEEAGGRSTIGHRCDSCNTCKENRPGCFEDGRCEEWSRKGRVGTTGVVAGNVIPLQNVLYALVWRRDDGHVSVWRPMIMRFKSSIRCVNWRTVPPVWKKFFVVSPPGSLAYFFTGTRDIILAAKTTICNDAMQGTMLLLETLTTACFSVVASFDSSYTSTACPGCLFLIKCHTFAKRDQ